MWKSAGQETAAGKQTKPELWRRVDFQDSLGGIKASTLFSLLQLGVQIHLMDCLSVSLSAFVCLSVYQMLIVADYHLV